MVLSQILKGDFFKNSLDFLKDYNPDIKGVTSDSRQVENGYIFVCQKGLRFDGHDHALEAEKNGAALIVCERDIEGVKNRLIVPDTRYAYAILCKNFFQIKDSDIKLIGVTGTNGKTSTTSIIKHILLQCSQKAGLVGTIQNEIDDLVLPAKHTTPDSYAFSAMIKKMITANCKYCVMEVSSHALDQKRTAGYEFLVSAFTNLTQDHLDYHKTMENYFLAKKKLFDVSKKAVINIDDSYGKILAKELSDRLVSVSIENEKADFFAKNIKIKADGSHFDIVSKEGTHHIDFCMTGQFSVLNALTAAAVCSTLGLPMEKIALALNSCKGVKGRTEIIKSNASFPIIRDYAHTPDGILKILKGVREFSGDKRIVILFGCAGNRDRKKRRIMAKAAAENSDFCILTSDNPRDEDVMQIINDALPGFEEEKTPYKVIPDRYDAIKWALENCTENDILILAGKGHEDYQVLDYGTIYFDEEEIVKRLTGYKN